MYYRSNFCYTSPRGIIQIIQEDGPPGTSANDVVEVCINEVNLTWSFEVIVNNNNNSQTNDDDNANADFDDELKLKKEVSYSTVIVCIDYKTGGPISGNLCAKSNNQCFYILKDIHGYSAEDAFNYL